MADNRTKPIICLDLDTGEETVYASGRDAANQTGIRYERILASASYGCKTAGTVWRWADGTPYKPRDFQHDDEMAKRKREKYAAAHGVPIGAGSKERLMPAGRVLSAFEPLLGDGWRGCAKALLDGFRAPLSLLLANVAVWYTNQHHALLPSEEIVRIINDLKKEYGE